MCFVNHTTFCKNRCTFARLKTAKMILDIIILIPLLWAAFKGFQNGLIKEVCSLVALCGGIYLAYHLSDWLSTKLDFTDSKLVAFAIIFIAVVILTFVVGNLVGKVVKWALPEILDKIFGVLFGALKIWVICAITISFVKSIDSKNVFISEETVGNSRLFPYIEKTVDFWDNYQKEREKPMDVDDSNSPEDEDTYDM